MNQAKSPILRKTYWDNYRIFLIIVSIIELGFGIYLGVRLAENYALFSQLRQVAEASVTSKPGDVICATGPVRRGAPIPKQYNRMFDAALQQDLNLKDILFARGAWKHSRGSGKSRTTYTDLRQVLAYDFTVETTQGDFGFRGFPEHLFSMRSQKVNCQNTSFGVLSPVSTWVQLEYFQPKELSIIGVLDRPQSGSKKTIASRARQPLIVSEVPLPELKKQLFMTVVLLAIALVYLVVSFLVHLKIPLKENFDRNRHLYLILDRTGGSEAGGIVLIIAAIIAGVVANVNITVTHAFQEDRKAALILLAFFALVHICKSIEFFYLCNRQADLVIEVSRGFFGFSQTPLCKLSEIKPHLFTHTGSKGEKSYSINARVNHADLQLTDAFSSMEKAQVILQDLQDFQADPYLEETE